MRVLLCHNNFHVRTGADVYFREVGRILEERGHEVAHFCAADASDGNGEGEPEPSPWREHFPTPVDYRRRPLAAFLRFDRLVYSREARRELEALVERFQPDVAHCFAIYTKLTPSILDGLRAKGVPTVCSLNDYKHVCPNYRLFHNGRPCEDCGGKRFLWAAVHRCSHGSLVYSAAKAAEAYVHRWMDVYRRNVHTFLFSSEFMARKTEDLWGAGTFRWRKLVNPFHSPAHAASTESGDALVFVGRLVEEKGVDVLLRAMRRVPRARLEIVGDGPERPALERLARELELENVAFLGARWNEECDTILRRARFTVVPSLWPENYPLVINMAFALGKPVIGADTGGIPELVRHGEFGRLCPPADAERLAREIGTLWDDPDSCRRLGAAAKRWSDAEFNHGRFYDSLMEIYGGVLA